MSWLQDRAAQAKALEERKQQIAAVALNLYESLWRQIVEIVDEARRERLFNLLTDSSGYERAVTLSVTPPSEQRFSPPKKLHIVLAKDRQSIVVFGDSVDIHFDLDACDEGIVCLKHTGQKISIDAAAIRILDAFLFPQLPGRY